MAPVPKKKHTSSRSKRRRNSPSKQKSLPNLISCPNCKKLKLPHRACPHCGFYR